jgi:hypothetical protein
MPNVVFKTCALFDETLLQHGAEIYENFEKFKQIKMQNHMQPFGSKDTPFSGDGPLGNHKPKLIHAHLTHDISLIYFLSGANPTVINLLGFFTHDAIGTGRPAAPKKQQSFVKRAKNQDMR